ncbi:MAG: FecR domain-containing protein [Alphaproteobacteria bacterium]|nr:FecR domain-containing protein [Alphaproteobacteria bacterium]
MPTIPRRAMLLGAAGLVASTGEAAARSGVVAAVVQASGAAPTTTVHTGDESAAGQTIATGQGELVNLLFADGTSVTVGARTVLRIEACAFNPATGRRQLAMTLLSGACHLICDAAARSGDITLTTPSGTISTRSTIATVAVTPEMTLGLVSEGTMLAVPAPQAGIRNQMLMLSSTALAAASSTKDSEYEQQIKNIQAYIEGQREAAPHAHSQMDGWMVNAVMVAVGVMMIAFGVGAGMGATLVIGGMLGMVMSSSTGTIISSKVTSAIEQRTSLPPQEAAIVTEVLVTVVIVAASMGASATATASTKARSTAARSTTAGVALPRPVPGVYRVAAALSSRPYQVTVPARL